MPAKSIIMAAAGRRTRSAVSPKTPVSHIEQLAACEILMNLVISGQHFFFRARFQFPTEQIVA